MNASWQRLFVPMNSALTPATLAEGLRTHLEQQGFQTYDPFPGGTGTPPGLSEMIRLFVAPPQDDHITVLGATSAGLLPGLQVALGVPCLVGWLSGDEGGFAVLADGTRHEDAEALSPYLRPGQTPDTLQQALAGQVAMPDIASDQPPIAVLGADALPPELRDLAQQQGVDPRKASSMFERLSGNVLGKLSKQAGAGSKAEQEQARALLGGSQTDVWNTPAGRRVRALAGVLHLPGNWYEPAFDTVREAYQIHRLRKRSPRLPLMPGDNEALKAVPDALDYIPVYVGRA